MALNLSRLVNKALCSDEAKWDAVVITHGTDTLEETAFFIDATLQCDKPVVVVGAMRPSTAIGADGGNNLLSAVTTAVTPSSRSRGTLIVLNDRICQVRSSLSLSLCISPPKLTLLLATQAFYCQKTQSNTVDTFKSPEQGFIGTLLSTKPLYYSTAAQPTFKRVYDLSNVTSLPPVEVLIGYQGADLSLMDTAVENGAKGIIIAGVGSGSVSETGKAHVAKAVEKGVPVVRSTKINVGASRAALPSLESTFSNRRTDPFLSLTLASSSRHRLQRPRTRLRQHDRRRLAQPGQGAPPAPDPARARQVGRRGQAGVRGRTRELLDARPEEVLLDVQRGVDGLVELVRAATSRMKRAQRARSSSSFALLLSFRSSVERAAPTEDEKRWISMQHDLLDDPARQRVLLLELDDEVPPDAVHRARILRASQR